MRLVETIFRFGTGIKAMGPSKSSLEKHYRLKLFVYFLSLSCSGCIVNKPVLTETVTVTATNGVVTVTERKLSIWSAGFWPASGSIAHQKGSVGKTLTVNSEGIEQQTGATNIADTIRALTGLAAELKKP